MSVRLSLVAAAGFGLLCATHARADVLFDQTFTGTNAHTGNDLAAHVVFTSSGNTLTLELTNVGDPAEAPSDVLTGLFWNMGGDEKMSASYAGLSNPTGKTPPDTMLNVSGPADLGKQWGYGSFNPPVFGDHYGVGAAGFGLFGKGSFDKPGKNVQGVDYGIVNGLGDHPNNGLMKGALASNSITFEWTGLTTLPTISDVHVQYGSSLSESTLSFVPEPTSVGVIALAACATTLIRRRPRR
jgi:hypothetical protein